MFDKELVESVFSQISEAIDKKKPHGEY